METIVVDAGNRGIGVLNADSGEYRFYSEDERDQAISRIKGAHRLFTFNGNQFDLTRLGGFPELEKLPQTVEHIDVMLLAWNNGFWGRGLKAVFEQRIGSVPDASLFSDDPHRDCFMTLELWKVLSR